MLGSLNLGKHFKNGVSVFLCRQFLMFIHFTTIDILILLTDIDDILVAKSNSSQAFSSITSLNTLFALRDLGHINYLLGERLLTLIIHFIRISKNLYTIS